MELQILLTFILAILTVTLVAVCIYVILVLRELRQTAQKANIILDDVSHVTDVIANPVNILTSAIKGFKAIQNLRNKEN